MHLKSKCYADLAKLTSEILQIPIVGVTQIQGQNLNLLSQVGLTENEIPIENSFCKLTIKSNNPVQIIDFSKDKALKTVVPNLFNSQVNFYYGMSLRDDKGQVVGTFFMMDKVARELSKSQQVIFQFLVQIVTDILYLTAGTQSESVSDELKLKVRQTAHEVNNQAAILSGGIYSVGSLISQGNLDSEVYKQRSEKMQAALQKIVNTVKDLRSVVIS